MKPIQQYYRLTTSAEASDNCIERLKAAHMRAVAWEDTF